MPIFSPTETGFELRLGHEVMRVDAWGADAIRVRIGQHSIDHHDLGALEPITTSPAPASWDGRTASLVNGAITAIVEHQAGDGNATLLTRFTDTATGEELLAETRQHFWWPGAHSFISAGSGAYQIREQFAAYPGERIYGLGQRTHGRLDHKGLSLELIQRNGEVNVPFFLSSRGYGFLWNNPGVGRVEFAENATSWSLDSARQIDYWITAAPTPAEIMAHYADAVGHAPQLPPWASGFWQSKLRYLSQDELLEVAREYRRRGLPLSVIVTDFFHWTAMGDYRFDPAEYPDPRGMMTELREMGVHLMASIWPTISPLSENYETWNDSGFLVGSAQGVPFQGSIRDKRMEKPLPIAFYDSTNPAAREYLWGLVDKNYRQLGVDVWWLDACEPEVNPVHPANLSFHAGPGAEVVNIYPRDHARGFAENNAAAGGEPTVLLCRSAWAGQAKYGAAVWSGDIPPTWDSLARQVPAGLSIGIAGIPWWTTDIGGFHGGDPTDQDYQELMIRWFQYGVFCPLFRLHGHREPRHELSAVGTGGPNEVWSYGEQAYEIIADVLRLREALRPYVHEQMDRAAAEGLPPMRPLFVDFPDDEASWGVEDEFLFGPDYLIAPITAPGTREREVYLPAGATWTEVHTGEEYEGGTRVRVAAPLQYIPVFGRDGAVLPA